MVALSKGRHVATFTLMNRSTEAVRLQVSGYAWDMSEDGEIQLKPTDALVLFPPLLVIPPLQSRAVRLGVQVPPGATEQSFRVYFEELPSLDSQLKPVLGPTITLREKIGVPVFIEPAQPLANVQIARAQAAGGRLHVTLENVGNAHLSLSDLVLSGISKSGTTLFSGTVKGWYLLAGDKRTYDVAMPTDACRSLSRITIDGKVNQATPFHRTGAVSCGA
jgi:fimbrial chaperone protein